MVKDIVMMVIECTGVMDSLSTPQLPTVSWDAIHFE